MRFILISAVFSVMLIFLSTSVQAYEDVPPAVPVDAVKAESLPLPEPIKKNAQNTQKQSVDDKKVLADKERGGPNALERLLGKILNVTKPDSSDEPKGSGWDTKKKNADKAATITLASASPIKAQRSQNNRYLTRALMPAKPDGGGFYVLELFTTQACPFCPKADAMMEIYSSLSHVIALSCHIDYFDVKEGSLSLPMCSSRQTSYEHLLKGKPKYTPQMVVNGRYDAVGYLSEKIASAFKQAHELPVEPLMVVPKNSAGFLSPIYRVELPSQEEGRYQLWLLSYDNPLAVTVKDGANAGKSFAYYNTVTKALYLGSWDGRPKGLTIEPKLPENTKGFSFFVQDADTGAIILAGKNE